MATRRPGSFPQAPTSCVRSRAGFTLAELLASLTLSGIVAVLVVQVMSAQGTISRLQGARTETQQNARSALELIVSELRGVDPSAILEAEPEAITFATPRAWGVVCSHVHDRLAAVFPTAAVAVLRTGEEFLAIPPVGSGAAPRLLEVMDRTGAGAERAQAQAACESVAAGIAWGAGSQSQARMFAPRPDDPSPEPLGIATGAAGLGPGSPVYVYSAVRYQVSFSPSSGAWWIRRNTGPAMQMHPLAGPVPEHGGLHFDFLDAAGEPLLELAGPEDRQRIRRVVVRVVARSRETVAGASLFDTASTVVVLRNGR